MAKPTKLAPKLLRALDQLKSAGLDRAVYLAGGTALTFHLEHRESFDLDLFGENLDLESLRRQVVSGVTDVEVLDQSDATLRVQLGDTPIDFVNYPYPLLASPAAGPCGFPVAGLRDIAAMKLTAVLRRGLQRDFWDLYEICLHGVSLKNAAEAYRQRFHKSEADLYHILKALTYFADAEAEPARPRGLGEDRWSEIKEFFAREAPSLLMKL